MCTSVIYLSYIIGSTHICWLLVKNRPKSFCYLVNVEVEISVEMTPYELVNLLF